MERIKTYITHNKGGKWDPITAPTEDMSGQATKCSHEDGCTLNLHIKASYGSH